MCKFFSFCGDGYGDFKYSPWSIREQLLKDKSEDSPDSHTFILRDIPVELQDRWSRYEYNPLTKEFTVDQGVEGHNHNEAEKWVNNRDWSTIVPALVIKPIINPFNLPKQKVSDEILTLLRQWASVRVSVGASVGASVRVSVGASFRPPLTSATTLALSV